MTTILKTTSRGQVTLPANWRKEFDTNQFIATIKKNKIEIEPLILQKKKNKETWQNTSAQDILKNLGPISKEEANYYQSL